MHRGRVPSWRADAARTEGAFPCSLEGRILVIKGLEAIVFRCSPRAQACLSKNAEIIDLPNDVQLTEG